MSASHMSSKRKISLRVKRLFGLGASILAVLLLMPALSFGQTPTAQESASGLQISPTRSELTVNPGKSENITISVKNITRGDITAKAEINDFVADNDTGTPRLLTNETEPAATSIKLFLGAIPDINLKVGETKTVVLHVNVPPDQPAGGYYGVIRFKAFPADNAANSGGGEHVALTASVGHIVLVQVPGKVTEKLEAINLSAEYHKNPSNFFIHPADSMRVEVKNVGGTFIKPFGNVVIKDRKGHVVYQYELNATDPRGNVLPKSTRVFRDSIKNIASFGHYTAVASISYGNGGDVLALKTSFWVVPLWMLIVAIVVLALIVLAILFLYRRLRKHRRGFRRKP